MTYRPLGRSGLMVSAVGLGCNNFGGRVDQDGVGGPRRRAGRRRHAARHRRHLRDTPGASEDCSARCSRAVATRSSSRRSSAGLQGAQRRGPRARGSRRYIRRAVDAACAGCRPTTSTSTSCTRPTRRRRSTRRSRRSTSWSARARCATSAVRSSPAGSWSRPRGPRETKGLERFVSAQNHWSLLDRDRRGRDGARRASSSVSACCRSSRWRTACSPASTSAATPPPRAPAPHWTPPAPGWLARPTGTASRPSRRTPRSAGLPPRRGDRRPRRPAGRRVRHLGSDHAEQVLANAAALRWEPTADDLAALADVES